MVARCACGADGHLACRCEPFPVPRCAECFRTHAFAHRPSHMGDGRAELERRLVAKNGGPILVWALADAPPPKGHVLALSFEEDEAEARYWHDPAKGRYAIKLELVAAQIEWGP